MCWDTVVLFDEREMSLWGWAGCDVVWGDFACGILLGIRGVVPALIGEQLGQDIRRKLLWADGGGGRSSSEGERQRWDVPVERRNKVTRGSQERGLCIFRVGTTQQEVAGDG